MHVSIVHTSRSWKLHQLIPQAATLVLLAALNFALPVQVMGSPGPQMEDCQMTKTVVKEVEYIMPLAIWPNYFQCIAL